MLLLCELVHDDVTLIRRLHDLLGEWLRRGLRNKLRVRGNHGVGLSLKALLSHTRLVSYLKDSKGLVLGIVNQQDLVLLGSLEVKGQAHEEED